MQVSATCIAAVRMIMRMRLMMIMRVMMIMPVMLMLMSTTPAQLESLLLQRVEACFVQAEARLGRTFTRPRVYCNMRGRAAGSARLQTW